MDGRPHPPEDAPHTWYGFSTGRFVGETLVVTTTHLKEMPLHRAGPFYSDKATVTEYINRHGDYLMITVYVEDPVPHKELDNYPCIVVEGEWQSRETFPHFLPGKNPSLTEYSDKVGIPLEAARGGVETMYPEYVNKLKTLK
jgi:hypothetical protein